MRTWVQCSFFQRWNAKLPMLGIDRVIALIKITDFQTLLLQANIEACRVDETRVIQQDSFLMNLYLNLNGKFFRQKKRTSFPSPLRVQLLTGCY